MYLVGTKKALWMLLNYSTKNSTRTAVVLIKKSELIPLHFLYERSIGFRYQLGGWMVKQGEFIVLLSLMWFPADSKVGYLMI